MNLARMKLAFLSATLYTPTSPLMADASASKLLDDLALPARTTQAILVTSPDADAVSARLQRFERERGRSWKPAAPPHSAVLGRSGLAWGRGLHRIPPDAPRKAEGDGKAPAGVFELGTAFGYEEEPPAAFRWRYRQATKRDFFVDDPDARNYNEWVNLRRGDPESRWASFERMRRQDQLYRLGLVVKHNTDPIVPGAGSAIFLHVWRGPGEPTAGCTALAENDLRTLLQWLRPRRHPLLIQIARSQLSLLRLEIAPKP